MRDTGTTEPIVELVDSGGVAIGAMPKRAAHEAPGVLHRAISVVLVDTRGRTLLQQRATGKYHTPRTWANSCCGHPFPGEVPADAASRRVADELGIHLPPAAYEPAGIVVYSATDPRTGLVEHEYDHLFAARFDGEPRPDPGEVQATDWVPIEALLEGWRPPDPAPWLDIVLDAVAPCLRNLGTA